MRRVARAARALAVAAVLLGGCGDAGGSAGTTTSAAKAACTKPALLSTMRAIGAGTAVETLRCAPGYAFTLVGDGRKRAVVLWHDVEGRWTQVARDVPGACPAQARSLALCTPPRVDEALRRCTQAAFLHALADDVDQKRFRVLSRRCVGDYAATRFLGSDCKAGQTASVYGCERIRVAAWRRGPARWQLITYRPRLDCSELRAAAPRFPQSLCR
jgi:hypothetical protein